MTAFSYHGVRVTFYIDLICLYAVIQNCIIMYMYILWTFISHEEEPEESQSVFGRPTGHYGHLVTLL